MRPFFAAALFFASAVVAQVPTWPQTWALNASTIAMTCNSSGLTDPLATAGFAFASFDWSNALAAWSAAKPMNTEELLVEQVRASAAVNPGQTFFVYRNGIKALRENARARARALARFAPPLLLRARAPRPLTHPRTVMPQHGTRS